MGTCGQDRLPRWCRRALYRPESFHVVGQLVLLLYDASVVEAMEVPLLLQPVPDGFGRARLLTCLLQVASQLVELSAQHLVLPVHVGYDPGPSARDRRRLLVVFRLERGQRRMELMLKQEVAEEVVDDRGARRWSLP